MQCIIENEFNEIHMMKCIAILRIEYNAYFEYWSSGGCWSLLKYSLGTKVQGAQGSLRCVGDK